MMRLYATSKLKERREIYEQAKQNEQFYYYENGGTTKEFEEEMIEHGHAIMRNKLQAMSWFQVRRDNYVK